MTLDKKWEKFRGGQADGPQGRQDQVRVTINCKGMIYFSAKAYQCLGRPKAVALYYSREDDAIAVEPAYPRFVEHFQVAHRQNGWMVHASTFCRHYKIRIPTTERFIRPDINDEGIMILSLRETVTVGGIKRRPRKRPADAESDPLTRNLGSVV